MIRHRVRLLGFALLPLVGCVGTPAHQDLAATSPLFVLGAFFDGETVGEGVLQIDVVGKRRTHVVGHGHIEADGTVVLVQDVKQDNKTSRTRTWHIHPSGDGRFTGTLTDATGPVAAFTRGNMLHIGYVAKGGLAIEQWLYLQPGERTALNRMVVRKLGVVIASLKETITKR